MATKLTQLKLVPVKKPTTTNPVVVRRAKLFQSIHRQIIILEKYRKGEKTNRQWFWMNEDGNIFLQIKYGKIPLELAKGKFAIQCDSLDEVESNLEIVEVLIGKGEFDQLLTEASMRIRKNFRK